MSNTPRDLSKENLVQLQCHFTWAPQKETIDLEDMMYRLQDSIDMNLKYKAHSCNQLAFVNCLKGNYEEAIQNLKEAEKILREDNKDEFERRSIITYGNFAWVHYHMGQLTEVQSYLDKLEMICKPLSDGPRYTAMIPEVYGEKGWSLLRSTARYYEEAKECFEKALEEDPDNVQWNMGYATVLFRLEAISGTKENREQSQSVKHLRRVLELDPDDSLAMVLLALKLQELKKKKEANELVEQALQKTSDYPKVLRNAAKFYRKEKDVEKAIMLLKKALEISPHSSVLHDQIGMCYRIKLLELIANPLSKDPQNPEFQQKADLFNQCKYHFGKAFEHRPKTAVKSQRDLADICVRNGEYSKADEIYSNLLKLDDTRPENMQTINLDAGLFYLFRRKSEDEGITLLKKALKIEIHTKVWKRAYEHLEKWANKKLYSNPHDSMALGAKGLLHQLVHNKSKATECYEEALQFDPGNEEYLSALCQLRLTLEDHNDV
ncbi:interferon-induced protein with tetratricopeptide repeats 5-like isoform X2 [Hypanus sabinus]|uniref:interferon-induced protein with tetratricopeptide repeats 5-like isoform X1 n=2 Tax=Hypanus sabinus TaxID=79690 RepID=UPI0028C4EB64|nr:interferon-induced protein with tetratricopeptide repeats 5-like isoform X1 [Hypanus sabinus]XP_059803484.1 interferon-induced protein with tetratricopeptide repeats 5-like isoform X2 [Hypanus sabinus]